MAKFMKGSILLSGVILMTLALASCLGGGGSSRSTGTLDLSLIDDSGNYDQVVVTIAEVQVHHQADGWITLSGSDLHVPMQVNLLDLVNGSMAYIGASELQPGHYDQMRLILDSAEGANYIVVTEGGPHENLKIPSGFQTGIKLVRGFDIAVAGSTELILDFDVNKSIVKAGNSGKYILKPTIKVVDTVTNSVSGTVREDTSGDALGGALVGAQKYDETAASVADRVMVAASTPSSELESELGQYSMYLPLLPPGAPPYNIVATLEGYEPACIQLPDSAAGEYEASFDLIPLGDAADSKITFIATIAGLAEDPADPANSQSVTISIRRNDENCGMIEVASFNLGNVADEELVTLPVGAYLVVVTSDDVQVPDPFEVTGTTAAPQIDLDFTTP
jgi:hypothetical protein